MRTVSRFGGLIAFASSFLFHDLRAVVVVLVQTDGQTDDQSDQAGYRDDCYEADAPPSPSPRDIRIVPQVIQLLSLGTGDIP